jgi:quinohemoprotein ethanol dehydrogenase
MRGQRRSRRGESRAAAPIRRCMRRARARAALAALVSLAPCAVLAQRGDGDAFAPARLIAPPRDAWRTNGGNLYNQRYSASPLLDPGNVGALKGVWRTRLLGSGRAPQYSGEAQPLVHDGRIFVITGADDVFALGVETGEILWQHGAELDPKITSVCCGWTSRGVGLGAGKVFVGQLDGKLLALDEKTGTTIWSVQAERWEEGFSITSAPLYYAGLVITGFSGAEIGVRGRVKAFDAKSGKLVWTFYTIPGPGDRGHETWPKDNDVWKHGGATVWQTPAVDPELGLVYFSTGNPGPDFNGAVRAGDNLYANSIVAIDAKTGKYRWHFQQVHHDLWDYDAPNPVVLVDVQIGGVARKALAEVGKTGWAYILDRKTGEPLIGIDERPVPQEPRQATAATQPYPRGDAIVPQQVDIPPEGFKLVNEGRIFTPYVGADGMIVNPSLYGGANWPPSSYDPTRGWLFVCASSVVGNFVGGDRDFEIPSDGVHYEGGVVGFAALPRSGIFAALDVATNRLVWRYRWTDQCYSGSVATAGGLVFVGRNDGRLTALESATGAQRWEFQTGAGMNAPVTVFEHAGKPYVVAYSAGNALVGTAHGDSVWLFGLEGTLPSATPRDSEAPVTSNVAPAPSSGSDPSSSGAARQALVANGQELFALVCVTCHGEDGKGGHGGGMPLTSVPTVDFAVETVSYGRNNMPAFGSSLSAEQIRAVSEYIVGSFGRPQ